eukprot:TRINITY_DN28149_c0_g1_i2.p1 TRINITY_DN28149_c0_g1~~TRINITY_DN28149_c0_g1_i2.p1  ORF type:complete len:112 (-),score=28.48 TRINITY_DN28149_c0_g1_i2:11-346(-)
MMSSDTISKYSWSDGRKRVSIYVELLDADDLAEEAFTLSSSEKEVSLSVQGSPNSRRRNFALAGLYHTISSAKVVQKKGKGMISIQLQKKDELPWPQLLENKVAALPEDDD